MNLYLALLRGINVGGKNLIKMPDLAACFEAQNYQNVRTYIQSGNVIFSADDGDQTRLTSLLEETLSKTFNYGASLVLLSHEQMKDVVGRAPEGFGSDPEAYRYDVLFLKKPLTASEAMRSVIAREGVDQVFAGTDVLYFSRLISQISKTYLTRIIGSPIYQSLTIRNWNTTTKLLSLMDSLTR